LDRFAQTCQEYERLFKRYALSADLHLSQPPASFYPVILVSFLSGDNRAQGEIPYILRNKKGILII